MYKPALSPYRPWRESRKRSLHGVVCGHIHHAEIREIDGVLYCNDGDWVESLTALVEHADGRLEITDWSDRRAAVASASAPDAQADVGGLERPDRPIIDPVIARG